MVLDCDLPVSCPLAVAIAAPVQGLALIAAGTLQACTKRHVDPTMLCFVLLEPYFAPHRLADSESGSCHSSEVDRPHV